MYLKISQGKTRVEFNEKYKTLYNEKFTNT